MTSLVIYACARSCDRSSSDGCICWPRWLIFVSFYYDATTTTADIGTVIVFIIIRREGIDHDVSRYRHAIVNIDHSENRRDRLLLTSIPWRPTGWHAYGQHDYNNNLTAPRQETCMEWQFRCLASAGSAKKKLRRKYETPRVANEVFTWISHVSRQIDERLACHVMLAAYWRSRMNRSKFKPFYF